MAERFRVLAATAVAFGGLLLGAVGMVGGPAAANDTMPASTEPTPTTPTAPTASATPTTAVEVTDAVLRWGINDESSNSAFAPGTYNFFSAGRLPDPGHGGATVASGQWRQREGHVSIQKWDGSSWRDATWAGLSTDSAGAPLGSPTEGRFSGHTFVMNGGVGTVEVAAGSAHIAWDGDVTVLYYSGMSFFYLTDPVVEVVGGVGTLTATVQGYASSLTDPTSWAPVDPAVVTVADLGAVDLGDERGFTARPAYDGSFPADFVAYMDRLGTGAFWQESGGATDAFKEPLPLTISYDAASAVPQPTPSTRPTRPAIPAPTLLTPPATATATVTAAPSTVVAPAAPPPPPAPSAPSASAPSAAPVDVPRPTTQLRLSAAPTAAPAGSALGTEWPWWAAGGLLLAAAALLLVPARRPAP